MEKHISEIIDIKRLQSLVDKFTTTTGASISVADKNGDILIVTALQDICTQFHKTHPDSCKKCIVNNPSLARKIINENNYSVNKCTNGLTDVAMPIIVNNEAIGTLFIGQFLSQEPDLAFFRAQALKYNYNEKEYLKALSKVKVIPDIEVKRMMEFMSDLTLFMGDLGVANLGLIESEQESKKRTEEADEARKEAEALNAELEKAMQSLENSNRDLAKVAEELTIAKEKAEKNEEQYRQLFENMHEGFAIHEMIYDKNNKPIDYRFINLNAGFEQLTGLKKDDLIGKSVKEIMPNTEQLWIDNYGNVAKTGTPYRFENYSQALDKYYNVIAYSPKKDFFAVIFTDVTQVKIIQNELVHAKEKAEESQERFTLAMNAAKDGLYDWNLITNKIYYSPAWKNMLGYKDAELPNDFSVWEKSTKPEDVERSWKMQQEVINKQRDRFEMEFKMRHKDGHWVDILSRAEAVFNEDGKAIRMIGTHIDITERKRALEKIRIAEENLKNTFKLSPSIISKVSTKTNHFTEVNPAVSRILGYTIDEFKSKPISEFIHPDDFRKTASEADAVKSGKELASFENRYLCKDGSYKWMAWHATKPDKDGVVTAIGSDITERKQTEIELIKAKENAEKNEARLIDAQSVAKVGNWETNLLTMEVIWSDETYKIFELNKDEFHDSHPSFLNYVHPNDIDRIENAFAKSFSSKSYHSVQHRIITPSKKIKNVEERWRIMHDATNKPIKAFGTCQDITKIKQFEFELIKAKEKAEESDRLKSAFLANMSHEIRTPMNGILGFSNLLKEPGLSGENQQKYLGLIEKSGARMLNTIQEIVDISKIESGQMKMYSIETNINETIEYVYNLLKLDAEQKGILFSLKNCLPNSEAKVKTDSEKLYGILTNLVKNAIKYTDKGSVEFGYNVKENFLEFYIKDTGIGIPKDRQEAIFERFVQADIADIEARQGAGLGLAITKAFVEMLGGQIWLESNEGIGSSFYFTLPYNTAAKKENSTEDAPKLKNEDEKNPSLNFKILIAEDDETSRLLLSAVVQNFSKEVLIAQTGNEAVEICRKSPNIDLILMDIQMPELNGYNATKEIRKFNQDVIIIAQTAFGLAGDREKAIEAGCNDYIAKPINKKELIAIVDKHLT